MPLFELYSTVTVSAYTTIEAENLEEAIKESENRIVEIGGTNSGVTETEVWVIDDADGSPQEIREA